MSIGTTAVDVRSEKRDAYDDVHESAYPIHDLIGPSDVSDDATSWSDVSDRDMDREVSRATEVVRSEGQYSGIARDLAVTVWIADLPRAPMSDLAFEDRREAVANGYWPYDMDIVEVREIVSEQFDRHDMQYRGAHEEAYGVITAAYADKLDPRADYGDRRP